MSPVKILNYHQKNFAINYEDMEKVKISNFFRNIKIKTKEKSYKYNIFNYGEVKKLREMFMSVIPNKVK